jgi:hypothetical protein
MNVNKVIGGTLLGDSYSKQFQPDDQMNVTSFNAAWSQRPQTASASEKLICPKHGHYFKDVAHLDSIDVYRVLSLFAVTDPCLQHAIKKMLVAGGRGAGKSIEKDVQEAIDTLERWKSMRNEEHNRGGCK